MTCVVRRTPTRRCPKDSRRRRQAGCSITLRGQFATFWTPTLSRSCERLEPAESQVNSHTADKRLTTTGEGASRLGVKSGDPVSSLPFRPVDEAGPFTGGRGGTKHRCSCDERHSARTVARRPPGISYQRRPGTRAQREASGSPGRLLRAAGRLARGLRPPASGLRRRGSGRRHHTGTPRATRSGPRQRRRGPAPTRTAISAPRFRLPARTAARVRLSPHDSLGERLSRHPRPNGGAPATTSTAGTLGRPAPREEATCPAPCAFDV